MSQYDTIDALILKCLLEDSKRAGVEFHQLETRINKITATPYRIIDRRLQALRKRGLIRHDSKIGWLLVEATA